MYRQLLDSKRTLQAIENKVVSRQNYAWKIMEQFEKLLEKRWRNPRLDDKPKEKLPRLKEIDTIPDALFFSLF